MVKLLMVLVDHLRYRLWYTNVNNRNLSDCAYVLYVFQKSSKHTFMQTYFSKHTFQMSNQKQEVRLNQLLFVLSLLLWLQISSNLLHTNYLSTTHQ